LNVVFPVHVFAFARFRPRVFALNERVESTEPDCRVLDAPKLAIVFAVEVSKL
jgi:hypothetical protein